MWGILAALAITYGLVKAAAAEPIRKIWWRRQRLAYLTGIPKTKLTRDQAADGATLSRQLGQEVLAKRFEDVTATLKRQ
jgi:hypothetical protein